VSSRSAVSVPYGAVERSDDLVGLVKNERLRYRISKRSCGRRTQPPASFHRQTYR
jgi:hypothetical protein